MKIRAILMLSLVVTVNQYVTAQNGEGNDHSVTIEDTTRDAPNFMDDPNYPENRKRFLTLDRMIDREFVNQSAYYSNNIYKPFVTNPYDLETLERFTQEAQGHIRKLKTNVDLNSMCAEYSKLLEMVRPGDRNQCEFLMGQEIKHINEAIQTAKDRIAAIRQKSRDGEVEKANAEARSSDNYSSGKDYSQNPQMSIPGTLGQSKAEANYQAALERQRVYQQNLQTVADVIVSTGVEIVNQIQQDRINNINFRNKQIGEYLQAMSSLDGECAQLFTEDYEAFLLKEKELRKYENGSLDHLNWLIDKTGESKYINLKGVITDNQKARFTDMLKHNTSEILGKYHEFKNQKFIDEFHMLYAQEINDFAGELSDENGYYASSEGGYQTYLSWVHFIDEERKTRTQEVLELNKSENFLSPLSEAAFYLFNNYYDPNYDKKVFEAFSNADISSQTILLWYAVAARNIVGYSEKDDRHLRLLLGDGSKPIYYYEVDIYGSKKDNKSIPLYKYLNHRDYGFKNTTANELVKNWIKRDEKSSGKKVKEIYGESLTEMGKDEDYITSVRNEIRSHVNAKDYKTALSLIEEAREQAPNKYELLIEQVRIYKEEGKFSKVLELLKEGIALKPDEPSLFFYIGVYEAHFGNEGEALRNYKKAIALNPDYSPALYNLGFIEKKAGNTEAAIDLFERVRVLEPENYQYNVGLGEFYLEQANIKTREANENMDNKAKWKEIFSQRLEYLKGALTCFQGALEIDDSDEGVKEQIPLLEAKIEQANSFLSKK